MGRTIPLVGAGAAALQEAYVQEKGACAASLGVRGGSSVQGNASPAGARVVTFGPSEEVVGTAAGILDTFLVVQVEAEREEGQNQDPVEGSLR